jgi:hypothetical protein
MSPAEAGRVRLVEMDEASFMEYRLRLVRDYARDKVRAGAWSPSGTEGRAAKDVDSLLPDGPNTPGHFLSSVRDESCLPT